MSLSSPRKQALGARGLLQLSFVGVAASLFVAACTDDAIVYPNRNLRPAAGSAGDAGEAGEPGEVTGGAPGAGAPSAGAPSAGNGGAKAGGGGSLGDAGSPDVGGGAPTGPVCGDGKVDPPEQCDDGNAISGDGCSADCQSSCEKCEKNVCPLYPPLAAGVSESGYDDCYASLGKITKGPATGYDRKEVCRELVDCVRAESCGQVRADSFVAYKCWCDADWVANKSPTVACTTTPDPSKPLDPTKFIAGACASLFQDASENDSLSAVYQGFSAVFLAEAQALRLLHSCDARVCPEECLPSFFKAPPVTTISADIVLKANPAGESPLGDLIADSQRVLAGADIAFVSSVFAPGPDNDNVDLLLGPTPNRDSDAPGRVLWSEALAVSFGFRSVSAASGKSNNPQAYDLINKWTFSGQQLYTALAQQFSATGGGVLFVSGLKYSYTPDDAHPAATVISNVRKSSDGSPIDPSASYTVALSSFLTGVDGPVPELKNGTNPTAVATPIVEVLGEYLTQLPQPVAPPELNRITRLN